jgi:hypothetical protein
MPSPMANSIRKILLLGNGLTFLLIAVYVFFAADKAAYLYGYTLNGVDGLNEFRAVYMGFWIGLTILFFTAAWKIEFALLGDLALTMVLMQSLGRLLSFIKDGRPSTRFIFVFFLEIVTSLAGLLVRPQTSPVKQKQEQDRS